MGNNKVLYNNDLTSHAEVVGMKDAYKSLESFQLNDGEICSSYGPYPMCIGSIYRATPKKVYQANNREDAAGIGFYDFMI